MIIWTEYPSHIGVSVRMDELIHSREENTPHLATFDRRDMKQVSVAARLLLNIITEMLQPKTNATEVTGISGRCKSSGGL